MAKENEKKDEPTELSSFTADRVENGWSIKCYHQGKKSLSQRAGWVPEGPCCKPVEYVEKTKDAVLKRLKEVL